MLFRNLKCALALRQHYKLGMSPRELISRQRAFVRRSPGTLHHLAHSLGFASRGADRGSASRGAARLLDSKRADKCAFLRLHKTQFGRTINLGAIDPAAFEPNQGAQETKIKGQSRTAPQQKPMM
jgi:hypothetical protein